MANFGCGRSSRQVIHGRLIGQTEARIRSGDVANQLAVRRSVALVLPAAVRVFFAESEISVARSVDALAAEGTDIEREFRRSRLLA